MNKTVGYRIQLNTTKKKKNEEKTKDRARKQGANQHRQTTAPLMLRTKSQGFVGFLAESDKEILGFVAGNSEPFRLYDIFYLREMCIKSALQRNGIGRKLYSELEIKLIEKGVRSIYLTTKYNIPASQFYQKNGFKISAEMRFFSKRIIIK